jgi:hypothetical protein
MHGGAATATPGAGRPRCSHHLGRDARSLGASSRSFAAAELRSAPAECRFAPGESPPSRSDLGPRAAASIPSPNEGRCSLGDLGPHERHPSRHQAKAAAHRTISARAQGRSPRHQTKAAARRTISARTGRFQMARGGSNPSPGRARRVGNRSWREMPAGKGCRRGAPWGAWKRLRPAPPSRRRGGRSGPRSARGRGRRPARASRRSGCAGSRRRRARSRRASS